MDSLKRIFYVLENHHLVTFKENKYYITEKGHYLRSDHVQSLRAAIAKEYDVKRWDALGYLHLSLESEQSAFQ